MKTDSLESFKCVVTATLYYSYSFTEYVLSSLIKEVLAMARSN